MGIHDATCTISCLLPLILLEDIEINCQQNIIHLKTEITYNSVEPMNQNQGFKTLTIFALEIVDIG